MIYPGGYWSVGRFKGSTLIKQDKQDMTVEEGRETIYVQKMGRLPFNSNKGLRGADMQNPRFFDLFRVNEF